MEEWGGMCECWRHTAMYLTHWLFVKSHPLDMAARCVALVIYSRASTLTLPCYSPERLINAVSTSAFCQCSLPSANRIQYQIVLGKHDDCILQIYGENPQPMLTFFLLLLSMEQNLLVVNWPRHIWCTQNVTGLNPACDLCWMSYPRCIQSFQLFCCCFPQLGTNAIKMHPCGRYRTRDEFSL